MNLNSSKLRLHTQIIDKDVEQEKKKEEDKNEPEFIKVIPLHLRD